MASLKKTARLKRSRKTRARQSNSIRLCVHRTPRHMYAQVISSDGSKVLCAASTLESAVRSSVKYTGNEDAAQAVGRLIAERAKAAGIDTLVFDRSGFKYHGRIKALADAVREADVII